MDSSTLPYKHARNVFDFDQSRNRLTSQNTTVSRTDELFHSENGLVDDKAEWTPAYSQHLNKNMYFILGYDLQQV